MNKESKLFTVIFTFVSTFAFVLILSIINFATTARIKRNEELFKIRAILNAFGFEYKSDQEAFKIFNEKVSTQKIRDVVVYKATVNGEEYLAFIFTGSGLWGTIQGVIAFDSNIEKVVGIDFISHSETPGLGGRIEEKWFKDQFKGKKIPDGGFVLRIGGSGDYDPDSGRFDAITGATSTSKAVEKIVNEAILTFKKVVGGERR
ncbi:FMN-binding protein [Pseudothermotoga thermarum]|uniref:FMN-binding domain protein n=1 Tax=Pseudothermotoga thermarum DSM 5069 TaxID=688269 RepID=F7YX83_9THEM|nr:FMN-binding protein [Pseudothermotoga thermarum]AEH51215.1 FMN-binding domain protein [Pseudothermotoga thermarum DSM 5069]